MLRFLLEKEFKQLRRNTFLPRMVIMLPFVTLSIFPLVANFDIENLNLAVVDYDNSPYSQRLINKATSSGYFRLTYTASTYDDALVSIEKDTADLILEIPADFERDLVSQGTSRVLIAANTVNGTRGGLGSNYLSQVISDFTREASEELAVSINHAGGPAFDIVPQYRFNPHLEYRVFMVPALLAQVLTMLCGFMPALNIVFEKENGTIEQMNVTPVNRFAFVLAKLIPFWFMGFLSLTISFGVAWLFYGMWPASGIAVLYLFSSVYVLAISGLGLVISNIANTVQQAMFMMFFFVMMMLFMSGLFTPVASMPQWAQHISALMPLKYFILILRQAYLKGGDIVTLVSPLLSLLGFVLFFGVLAILTYRKRT